MNITSWEYLSIGPMIIGGESHGMSHVTWYTKEGLIKEPIADIKPNLLGGPRNEINDALGALIAQLGKDGWEMVGADGGSLYFKRPTAV